MSRMFSPSQAAGDMEDGYTQPPPDIYFVLCEDIVRKTGKQSGKPYYEATLRVVANEEFNNCKFWDSFSLSDNALWRLGEFSMSCGNQQDWDIDSEGETKRMLKGRIGKCRTKWEEFEGVKRTKVKKWLLAEPEERQMLNNLNTGGGGSNSNLPDGPSAPRQSAPEQQPGTRARDDIPF